MTNEESGVIESRLPDHIPIYANEDQRCDIYISVPNGYEMMFYFDWLDLYSTDRTRCDNVNIELFDGSPNQRVQGVGRLDLVIVLMCTAESNLGDECEFKVRKGLVGWLGLVIVLVYTAESNLGDDCEFKGEEGLGGLAWFSDSAGVC